LKRIAKSFLIDPQVANKRSNAGGRSFVDEPHSVYFNPA
jgi:hypothetical protein